VSFSIINTKLCDRENGVVSQSLGLPQKISLPCEFFTPDPAVNVLRQLKRFSPACECVSEFLSHPTM